MAQLVMTPLINLIEWVARGQEVAFVRLIQVFRVRIETTKKGIFSTGMWFPIFKKKKSLVKHLLTNFQYQSNPGPLQIIFFQVSSGQKKKKGFIAPFLEKSRNVDVTSGPKRAT